MQRRGVETKARLLDAAVDCFVEHGYQAASVSEICRVAGVSKGAFYHHFSGKQGLFIEVLNRWLEGLDSQIGQALKHGTTVADGLHDMVDMVRPTLQMADDHLFLYLEFFFQARLDPEIWQAAVKPYQRYRHYFTRLIEDGVADGSLKAQDAEASAQLLISLVLGLLMHATLDPDRQDWGDLAERCVRMLLGALAKDE